MRAAGEVADGKGKGGYVRVSRPYLQKPAMKARQSGNGSGSPTYFDRHTASSIARQSTAANLCAPRARRARARGGRTGDRRRTACWAATTSAARQDGATRDALKIEEAGDGARRRVEEDVVIVQIAVHELDWQLLLGHQREARVELLELRDEPVHSATARVEL